ncbi:hypothetical protein HPP92_012864 [Vanilla planifolia]|uniref:Uncharacterized protein n=1 Tax=Vanilla planifolia TaxID=51239 RepID=A0A835QQM2_VANPL|nr:hypothetical protein HPP92_012864 [Vanilla planifolia]
MIGLPRSSIAVQEMIVMRIHRARRCDESVEKIHHCFHSCLIGMCTICPHNVLPYGISPTVLTYFAVIPISFWSSDTGLHRRCAEMVPELLQPQFLSLLPDHCSSCH